MYFIMNKIILLIAVLLLIIGCKEEEASEVRKKQTTETFDFWHTKDFEKDSIPGISLERLYSEVLKNRTGKEIIVAVLDTKINSNHEDLKSSMWFHKNEIENNGIDDDKNGYIDDRLGWNFLGNANGGQLLYSSNAHIRIINAYDSIFKGKLKKDIIDEDTIKYHQYIKALRYLEEEKKSIQESFDYAKFLEEGYPKSKKVVDSIFGHTNYTVNELDSLYKAFEDKDENLANSIYFMYDFTRFKMDNEAERIYEEVKLRKEKSNNINFKDREILGDNPNDIADRNYGNNKVNDYLDELTHGTIVSGVLAANRKNGIGVRGIYDRIKIMPVVIQPRFGDEYDKDLALAIRYAVDNGAKVISYSAIKYLSLHTKWVMEALKYADEHNVIFVRAAGNQSKNTDIEMAYPNDDDKNYDLHNFIVVGAIRKNFKKPWWSNYGKETVDLFAPGDSIPTTTSAGGYKLDSGTSMSTPMVAGVAAMLFSFYPELSAREVKEIILASASKYQVKTRVRIDKNTLLKLEYSDLCKSGGVLNAYAAFQLAAQNSIKKQAK